jgi:hypothetical protein
MEISADQPLHSEYFETLDSLRDSGAINMFGAPQWLEENFDLDRSTAKAVFIAWTESFSKRDR